MTQKATIATLKFPRTDTWGIITGTQELSKNHNRNLLKELRQLIEMEVGQTPKYLTDCYEALEIIYGEDKALEIIYNKIIESYE